MRRSELRKSAGWGALVIALAFPLGGCSDVGDDLGMNGDGGSLGPEASLQDDATTGDDGTATGTGDDSARNGDDSSNTSGDDASGSSGDETGSSAPGDDAGSVGPLELDAADDETGVVALPGRDAEAGPPADAGDATVPQGTPESGAPETSVPAEAAVPESGAEAGTNDAGQGEAGTSDAGARDADAGAVDSGIADTGKADGTVADSGASDADGGAEAGNLCDGAVDCCDPAKGGTTERCCDPAEGGTTEGCFAAQYVPAPVGVTGVDCLPCVNANGCLDPAQQGGTCEQLTGTSAHLTAALPDGKSCTILPANPTEEAICFQTLQTIFTSTCASTRQETPCLCGPTPVATCLAGTATPTGSTYDLTACDFDSTSVATIEMDYTVPTFGAGMANALVQCAAAYGCNCFGLDAMGQPN